LDKSIIRYKRFSETFTDDNLLQKFFDTLITDGWEIIYYDEEKDLNLNDGSSALKIVIVACKKQSNLI
jgi:hypothetical protein